MSTMLAFQKPGLDHQIPAVFHPIALTSCVCKLEKIVNVRLVYFFKQDD